MIKSKAGLRYRIDEVLLEKDPKRREDRVSTLCKQVDTDMLNLFGDAEQFTERIKERYLPTQEVIVPNFYLSLLKELGLTKSHDRQERRKAKDLEPVLLRCCNEVVINTLFNMLMNDRLFYKQRNDKTVREVPTGVHGLHARYTLANFLAKAAREKHMPLAQDIYDHKSELVTYMWFLAHELKQDAYYQNSIWAQQMDLGIEPGTSERDFSVAIGFEMPGKDQEDPIKKAIIHPHFGHRTHEEILTTLLYDPKIYGSTYPYGWKRSRGLLAVGAKHMQEWYTLLKKSI